MNTKHRVAIRVAVSNAKEGYISNLNRARSELDHYTRINDKERMIYWQESINFWQNHIDTLTEAYIEFFKDKTI